MNMEFTREQIRRFLVDYHHFSPETQLKSHGDIANFVRKVGCIQFDPLEAAGRNADLVLQSRLPKYRRGDLAHLLYEERILFDVWDKCMSICHIDDWPRFSRHRARYHEWLRENAASVGEVTDFLRANDSACSSDFDMETKVDWWYGNQRLAKAVLECMCYAGSAIIHHKRGTRRHYGLAERFIPEHLLNSADPNESEEEYHNWQVLRRINSIGVLWNRPGDAWLGIWDFKAAHRVGAFRRLLQSGCIVELRVTGVKETFYIDASNVEQLKKSAAREAGKQECRFIAPLDSFIWDRRQTAALFDFEYKWEVYTPAAERRYGYYVLPVLYGDGFMGRIEFSNVGKDAFAVKEFWPEKRVKVAEKKALKRALERFADYQTKKLLIE